MFPLPSQLPDRSKDYAVEIKGDPGSSNRLTVEEKGKGKALNVITLGKAKKKEAEVMPIGKRTTNERDNREVPGPSKKRGKAKEGDDATTKKKRRPRRHFQVSDFPMGGGQASYSLKDDIADRKANLTFGQIMELAPKLRQQWKSLANPTEKEPKKGSVTIMSVKDLEDICPEVEAWHKGRNLDKAYIDGGAQVSVITHACVE